MQAYSEVSSFTQPSYLSHHSNQSQHGDQSRHSNQSHRSDHTHKTHCSTCSCHNLNTAGAADPDPSSPPFPMSPGATNEQGFSPTPSPFHSPHQEQAFIHHKHAAETCERECGPNADPRERKHQLHLTLSSQNLNKETHPRYHLTSKSHIRHVTKPPLQHQRSKSCDLTPNREVAPEFPQTAIAGSPDSNGFNSDPTYEVGKPALYLREISISAENIPALCLNDCPITPTPLSEVQTLFSSPMRLRSRRWSMQKTTLKTVNENSQSTESSSIRDEVLMTVVSCLMHRENCQIPNCPCKSVQDRYRELFHQNPTLGPEEEERRYLAACEWAMKEKGSLEQTAMHCVFMGIPRSGKTSLIQRLLGKRPSVVSASTGVAERVVRVEIRKSTVHVSGLYWCELEDIDEEALTLMHEVLQAFCLLNSLQSPATPSEEQGMKPPLEFLRNAFHKKWSKLKELVDDPWTLYITDTGGQPEFQELLPILVSGPTLFFILFRLDWELNRRYQVEYITAQGKSIIPYEAGLTVQEMLLQSLATIASTRIYRMKGNKRVTINPDIFLVGTHKDCVSDDHLQEIDRALQVVVKGTEAYQKGMIQFASETRLILAVNNLSEGEEDVQQIRAAVERIGKQRENYRVKTPFSWLMFSNIMQHMRSPVLKYEQCFSLAWQCGIETRSEMNNALRFLHENVGVVRYYHDLPELREFIIKDPQYVFDMVTNLIVATFTFDSAAPVLCEQFTKRGIFPLDVFEKLARSTEFLPPSKLVALLQHLNIVALLKKDGVSSEYFIPCVLTHSEDSPSTVTSASSSVPPLLITFESGYCPKGLFGALVVYLLQNKMKSELEWGLEQDNIFRDQICLSVGPYDSFQLKVLPAFLSIELCTSTGASTRKLTLASVCREVQQCINTGIGKVSETLHCSRKAAHSFGFLCPVKVDIDQPSHPATVNFYRGEPCNMKCSVHGRFDLPKDYQVWFHEDGSVSESRITTSTGSSSGHHFSPGTEPTLRELLRFTCADGRVVNIPVEIATKYVKFGIFLLDDRNGSRVKIMARKHSNDAEEINTEILQEWLTGRGRQPVNWATLVKVLCDIKLSVLAGEIEAVKCPAGPV